MNPISDNLYDVALTAIRNCQWQGTEIEKVVRALEELEQQHNHAVMMRAKHPLVAAPLSEEAKKALADAKPGEILPVDMVKVEENIDAILDGKEPPHKDALEENLGISKEQQEAADEETEQL